MTKKWSERIFSLFLMAVALSIYGQTMTLPESKVGLLTGPAFYPQWVALLLFVCSGITLAKTIIKPSKDSNTMVLPPPLMILKLVMFLVLIGGILLVIPYTGWLGALFMLVFIIEVVFEKRKWNKALGVAILAMTVIFLIFEVGLGIQLPRPFE